jgi:hypothetical protein
MQPDPVCLIVHNKYVLLYNLENTMKTFLTISLLSISAFAGQAQTSTYSFLREGGQMSLLNPADPGVIEHTVNDDQVLPAKVKLGFPFKYNGATYDSVGISENGYIWFGSAQAADMENITNPITATLPAGVAGVVCAFGIDLHPHINAGGTTTIRSLRQDFNNHPDNFIIEWRNTGRFDALNDPKGEDTIHFQIQLYALEDDRVQISYWDSHLNPDVISQLSVGMKGASNSDFALRMTNANHPWDNTLAGTALTSTCEFSATSNPTDAAHNFMSWTNPGHTGLKDVRSNVQFNMYPMPASDVLFVEQPDGNIINSYRIYNIEGRLIAEKPYTTAGIAVSNLDNGMYVLHLQTAEGFAAKRFIKN